jgi:hypothetical protein
MRLLEARQSLAGDSGGRTSETSDGFQAPLAGAFGEAIDLRVPVRKLLNPCLMTWDDRRCVLCCLTIGRQLLRMV